MENVTCYESHDSSILLTTKLPLPFKINVESKYFILIRK